MAVNFSMLRLEQQRVGTAISELGGRVREWVLICSTSVDEAYMGFAKIAKLTGYFLRLIRQTECVLVSYLPVRARKNYRTMYRN